MKKNDMQNMILRYGAPDPEQSEANARYMASFPNQGTSKMEITPARKCDCGAEMSVVRENYRFFESGLSNIVLKNTEIHVCTECGARAPMFPSLGKLDNLIASILVEQAVSFSPDQIKFLRKTLDMTIEEFSKAMCVSYFIVEEWEEGGAEMEDIANKLLRLLVAVKLPIVGFDSDKLNYKINPKTILRFSHNPVGNSWKYEGD